MFDWQSKRLTCSYVSISPIPGRLSVANPQAYFCSRPPLCPLQLLFPLPLSLLILTLVFFVVKSTWSKRNINIMFNLVIIHAGEISFALFRLPSHICFLVYSDRFSESLDERAKPHSEVVLKFYRSSLPQQPMQIGQRCLDTQIQSDHSQSVFII